MMQKRTRLKTNKQIRFPFLVLGVFFLILWLLMIIRVDPVILADVVIPGYYLPFFGLLWCWSELIIYVVWLNGLFAHEYGAVL